MNVDGAFGDASADAIRTCCGASARRCRPSLPCDRSCPAACPSVRPAHGPRSTVQELIVRRTGDLLPARPALQGRRGSRWGQSGRRQLTWGPQIDVLAAGRCTTSRGWTRATSAATGPKAPGASLPSNERNYACDEGGAKSTPSARSTPGRGLEMRARDGRDDAQRWRWANE